MKYLLLLSLLLTLSCGNDKTKSSNVKQSVSSIFAAKELAIKVYYEEGAEPYTEGIGVFKIWNLTRVNLTALFSGRSTTINVPEDLSQMTKMTASNKTVWSIDNVLELSRKYTSTNTNGTINFHIYFVNGYASDGNNIIGFHINNTKVMVIFKDVIKGTGSGSTDIVPRYVEQSTIIHEMGHALGLVNNGVPLTSSHHDHANGAHCTNPKCVMYYMNEGTTSMVNYVKSIIDSKDLTMFEQECLNDTINYGK